MYTWIFIDMWVSMSICECLCVLFSFCENQWITFSIAEVSEYHVGVFSRCEFYYNVKIFTTKSYLLNGRFVVVPLGLRTSWPHISLWELTEVFICWTEKWQYYFLKRYKTTRNTKNYLLCLITSHRSLDTISIRESEDPSVVLPNPFSYVLPTSHR